jgi:thioredoxin-like negative regulator of GroEL
MKTAASCALIGAIAFALAMGAQAAAPRDFVSGSFRSIQDAHRGSPYVVALWALDCAHCKENLDLLARLSARYPDVALVLIATDAADAATVGDTLGRHGLTQAEAWMFADGFAERLIYEVDPRWHGEVPRTYLFAPGQSARAHTGRLDAVALQEWMSGQANLARSGLAQGGTARDKATHAGSAQGEAP